MKLSQNEYKIMAAMWEANKPMSRADILAATEGRNWNPASIHLILNAMISKGVLKITDVEKNYGRTYEPCMTMDEYLIDLLKENFPDRDIMQILKDCAKIQRKMKKED